MLGKLEARLWGGPQSPASCHRRAGGMLRGAAVTNVGSCPKDLMGLLGSGMFFFLS